MKWTREAPSKEGTPPSSFFLPFCSFLALSAASEQLPTTETDILYIYIYIFVSSRVYNIIVEFSFSTRVTVAKENRRRRLEILSRFHSLAVYSRLDSTKAVPFSSLPFSLFLSLSLPSIVCPVQAQSGIVPTVERREPCSAARKLNINRRQLCFDKIVTRRRHCHRDKRVNLVCLASLPPMLRSPNRFSLPASSPPLLSTVELFDYPSIPSSQSPLFSLFYFYRLNFCGFGKKKNYFE